MNSDVVLGVGFHNFPQCGIAVESFFRVENIQIIFLLYCLTRV
jgi:uncharacterized protein (UPF0212 family)